MADDTVKSPNTDLNNVHILSLYLKERHTSSLQRPNLSMLFKEKLKVYCEKKDKSINTTTVQSADTLSVLLFT
jgi:hypothetical protein